MIGIEQFTDRLLRLGAASRSRPWPRKRLDRHILMKSIALTLDSSCEYSEPQINEALRTWNEQIAPAIETDHVTLRRMLVDYGYLERRPDGSVYRVGFPPNPLAFALEVDDLDQRAMVAAYRAANPSRGPAQESAPAHRSRESRARRPGSRTPHGGDA